MATTIVRATPVVTMIIDGDGHIYERGQGHDSLPTECLWSSDNRLLPMNYEGSALFGAPKRRPSWRGRLEGRRAPGAGEGLWWGAPVKQAEEAGAETGRTAAEPTTGSAHAR
jgi:hypothetical protein